ncbi:class I SAM-dependent methyltransferase [Pseudoalteromonas sp. MMG005]|uniref:class I SAM-dependent methyltransferase n=1 Tax=Pseudoalteromonas sp. MMG005 TaxID=2822682 RepID=UPI001B39E61B|nr:class I SAM-dependent methyltransferase [Pseudoalteromonas sp. MMG005]MBQ4847725.1 class I SAM-dependent methyltransferase [Pseudoalteromonas sp. MMG005]
MWDERYNSQEYAYGTKPNYFLKKHVSALPKGRILSLGEGEGRNAVFLAKQGYSVTAVDSSLVGLNKGKKLAKEQGAEVEFIHADLNEYDLGQAHWDGIISIFFPLPSLLRKTLYKQVQHGLKNQGVFLIEAYRPEQVRFGTGGGTSVDTMQSAQSLSDELPSLNFNLLVELERNVVEGVFHTGLGAVVQGIATKM